MHNFFTWTIIVFLIVLIGVICLLTGIHLGKNILAQEKIEKAQTEAVQIFAEKVRAIPILRNLPDQPENIMYGTITAIDGQSIMIKVEPQTIDDIINELPTSYSITTNQNTKIYYIRINEQLALNNPADISDFITEVNLNVTDLKINDQVSITIDPVNKNKPVIEAKQIKVSR